MTSKDILRALRAPLQDFTNELVVQIKILAGERGSIRHDADTIFLSALVVSTVLLTSHSARRRYYQQLLLWLTQSYMRRCVMNSNTYSEIVKRVESEVERLQLLNLELMTLTGTPMPRPITPSESTEVRSAALTKYNTEPKVQRKLRFSGQWEHSKFADRWW